MCDKIIAYGIAKEDDRELYEYSFLIMLEQVSIGVSILIVSLFFKVLFETVLYMVLFIPLRIYAGGYHARSFFWCYVISVGAYLTFVVLLCYVAIPAWIVIVSVLISAVVIFLLAPMADPNKAMDAQEKIKFQKLVRMLLFAELAIFALSLWTKYFAVIYFIGFVFFHLALLLLAGYFCFRENKESSHPIHLP